MKIRYTGQADEKILSEADLEKLGFEDHPGLWWSKNMPVLDVDDDIAESLLSLRDFAVEPDEAEQLEESHTKEQLLDQARTLKISGASRMTKEELAEAIATAQADAASAPDASESLEPSA